MISPIGIQASLAAIARANRGVDTRRALVERQVQQFEYEARRAFEQYDEVDPRNRLVAEELERRWNAKLVELNQAKAKLVALGVERSEPSEEEKARLLELGRDFDRVWHSPNCPPEMRKKIVRTVVEEVIATEPTAGTLSFVVHLERRRTHAVRDEEASLRHRPGDFGG